MLRIEPAVVKIVVEILVGEKRREADAKYRKSPKGKAANAKYNKSPKGKAANAKYAKSPKRKAVMAEYGKTPSGKVVKAKYDKSPKGKAAEAKRAKSPKGKEARRLRRSARRLRLLSCSARRSNYFLGTTHGLARDYIESQFIGDMNWDEDMHVHHRIPLHFFNLDNPRAVLRAGYYMNLKPMSAGDHRILDHQDVDKVQLGCMIVNWTAAGLLDEGEDWAGEPVVAAPAPAP